MWSDSRCLSRTGHCLKLPYVRTTAGTFPQSSKKFVVGAHHPGSVVVQPDRTHSQVPARLRGGRPPVQPGSSRAAEQTPAPSRKGCTRPRWVSCSSSPAGLQNQLRPAARPHHGNLRSCSTRMWDARVHWSRCCLSQAILSAPRPRPSARAAHPAAHSLVPSSWKAGPTARFAEH